jgi:hypothetical protein
MCIEQTETDMIAILASPIRGIRLDEPSLERRASRYELRFAALFNAGRGYAFPCDAGGNVNLDGLTERARANYFYARTTIGREFCTPVTCDVVDGGLE